jgi:hypothetical protein
MKKLLFTVLFIALQLFTVPLYAQNATPAGEEESDRDGTVDLDDASTDEVLPVAKGKTKYYITKRQYPVFLA